MATLKLGAIIDERPVRLTIELPAAVHRDLTAYADVLADKPEIVVLNKIDALTPEELKAKVKALKKASKAEVHTISGATGEGVEKVLYDVLAVIDESRAEEVEASAAKAQEKWTP